MEGQNLLYSLAPAACRHLERDMGTKERGYMDESEEEKGERKREREKMNVE